MPVVSVGRSVRDLLVPLLLLALGAGLLYGHALDGSYFADDFNFVYDETVTPGSFFSEGFASFFRPIEGVLLHVTQEVVGLETWPLHLLSLSLHVGVALLVWVAARQLRLRKEQAALGAAFFLVTQAAPYAVLGVDTVSQVVGTGAGALAVWLLWRALYEPPDAPVRWGVYAAAVAALAVSLLGKETSAAFVPILLGLLGLAALGAGRRERLPVSTTLLAAVPILVTFAVYLVLRDHVAAVQPALSDAQYGFALGPNVLRNLAQFGLAAVVPVSTAAVFLALEANAWGVVAVAMLGAGLLAALVGGGLWRTRRGTLVAVLLGGALLALFPAVLLNHVSELYLYNALPFVAVLVGMGLGRLWMDVEGRQRVALGALLLLLLGGHAVSSAVKAGQMEANGRRAAAYLVQLAPIAEGAAPGRPVLLVDDDPRPSYSQFVLPGLDVLRYGDLPRALDRPDLTVEVVDGTEEGPTDAAPVLLTLRGGRLVPVTP